MTTDALSALGKLFAPRSLAVVGASANYRGLGARSLGLLKNFGYGGKLFAVNPRAEESHGVKGYASLADIDEPIDLCLIVVPVKAVAQVVQACAAKPIPVAQILTSGFAESGQGGREAEAELPRLAAGRTRLVGPNCLGVYCATAGMSFVTTAGRTPGQVSIASQSGGLSVDMLLQAKARGLDLGKLVSIGNCADLDPMDFLSFFGSDPQTQVIGLYLEGIKRGEAFLATLRRVAAQKPVVILKGGRTPLGAVSAASHTNSLAGEYAVWQSAMDQCGALLEHDVDGFLATLTALQRHLPPPRGNGVALVGNGGGATVLASDLLQEQGLTLAALQEGTQDKLHDLGMPAGSTVGNPTDTPVGALNKKGSQALGGVVGALLADQAVNAVVVHFNLLPFINYENRQEIAEGLSLALKSIGQADKPVFVGLRSIPDAALEELRQFLLQTMRELKLPCFASAGEAVVALAKLHDWARARSQTEPAEPGDALPPARPEARQLLQKQIALGRRSLLQGDAFRLLDMFGISHPPCRLAEGARHAAQAAAELGFPVALKIESPQILHKTDAQGVALGLKDQGQVEAAYERIVESARKYDPQAEILGALVQKMSPRPLTELICGLKQDPVFGPVLLFGLGGVLVEVIRDFTMRVLPISRQEAGKMWQGLAGASLLRGYRGGPEADTAALEDLLLKVSALGAALSEIAEMDLNPIFINPAGEGLEVVDCRILLRSP